MPNAKTCLEKEEKQSVGLAWIKILPFFLTSVNLDTEKGKLWVESFLWVWEETNGSCRAYGIHVRSRDSAFSMCACLGLFIARWTLPWTHPTTPSLAVRKFLRGRCHGEYPQSVRGRWKRTPELQTLAKCLLFGESLKGLWNLPLMTDQGLSHACQSGRNACSETK